MSLIARTREALGIAPLPRPVYHPNVGQPAPTITNPPARPAERRHHPLLDRTAIAVRKTLGCWATLCFCCERPGTDAWLCEECTTRGCGS